MYILEVQPVYMSGTPVVIKREFETLSEVTQALDKLKAAADAAGITFKNVPLDGYHNSILCKETASSGGWLVVRKA